MHQFFDIDGNIYTIRLTVGALERFKAASGVDLLSGVPTELAQVFDSPISLIKGVAGICSEQLANNGYSGEKALDAFDGASCQSVYQAFTEELVDFFLNAERNGVTVLLRRMIQVREESDLEAVEKIRALENSVTESPEESESVRKD